jgi:ABC-type sugar transport system ATPase subunit
MTQINSTYAGVDSPSTLSVSRVPALEAKGLVKRYPGVVALDNVNFAVHCGEIHALLGENGAGKSTLIRMLTGLAKPDSGTVFMGGQPVEITGIRDARRHGIELVPQDVLMVPEFSVGRNILLGLDRPFTDTTSLSVAETERVEAILEQIGATFSPRTSARDLSVSDLRLAQIARAFVQPSNVIILDEPTAVLSEADADRLLEKLIAFRSQNKAIVYVSHRLSEVFRVADNATILRDGKNAALLARDQFDRSAIVSAMARVDSFTSSQDPDAEEKVDSSPSKGALRVTDLTSPGRYSDVSLTANEGEIVGIAGVQGSGHGFLLRDLAGLAAWKAGTVTVNGVTLPSGSVRAAYQLGISLVPADRRQSAIVVSTSVRENLILGQRIRLACRRFGLRWPKRERDLTESYIKELDIHPPFADALAGSLSGGNQQKLALARMVEGDSKILLIEEPTQGVDVRAKAEIHRVLRNVARKQSRAVVVASSEFEELMELADIIHVMSLGRLVATFKRGEADYKTILHYALP